MIANGPKHNETGIKRDEESAESEDRQNAGG